MQEAGEIRHGGTHARRLAPGAGLWHKEAMSRLYDRTFGKRFPDGIPWRSRAFWHPVGYGLTALWMVVVLVAIQNDTSNPLFDYLFAVPLAGWIAGIIAASILNRFWPAPRAQTNGRRTRP